MVLLCMSLTPAPPEPQVLTKVSLGQVVISKVHVGNSPQLQGLQMLWVALDNLASGSNSLRSQRMEATGTAPPQCAHVVVLSAMTPYTCVAVVHVTFARLVPAHTRLTCTASSPTGQST